MLDKQYEDKETEREREHAERKAKLDEREKELDEHKKKIDLRESKAVRRQLREDLKKVLKERGVSSELTKGTQNKRWIVFGVYVLFIVALAIFTGIAWWNSPKSEGTIDWVLLVRQGVWAVSLLVTIGFFVRWNNQWFIRHADEEFRLKRLELDIDRASWIVEQTLEWKSEGGEIPQHLLEQLTKNLFAEDRADHLPLTAADGIAAALLGSSASVRLKAGNAEFLLDRKGLRKLKKERLDGGGLMRSFVAYDGCLSCGCPIRSQTCLIAGIREP